MLSRISGLDVTVVPSSEYAQLPQSIRNESAVLTISQSGETSDTLRALQDANDLKCPTIAITNSAGSSMSLQADVALLTPVGTEVAIPATKSFTGQLLVLLLLALCDPATTASSQEFSSLAGAIEGLPARLKTHLPIWFEQTKTLSEDFRGASSFFYLGTGIHAGIAAEGALKLKESAYRHAEAYNTGEIEHGPNALITQNMPIFLIEPEPHAKPQVSTLSDRLEKQGARMIKIVTADSADQGTVRSHTIAIENTSPYLQTILEVVPLQMFAYHSAAINDISMDRPRNHTKAVILRNS
jgi:glucosamine--fructose-6-phosphate aminotransferase (isomerizing)